MRTKTTQAIAVIANPSHGARVVVFVADSGGTLRELGAARKDLTDGINPVTDLTIEESVDTVRTCNFTMMTAFGKWNRSPLVLGATNPFQPSTPTVTIGRAVKVVVTVTPPDHDIELSAGCTLTVFEGFVDAVDFAEGMMEVTCTDKMAVLRDTWIEKERVYGFCTGAFATKGAFVWRYDNVDLAIGDLVIPSKLKMNGHFYRVTAKVSAGSTVEPTWPTGGGSTVVSGGITFTESGATSTVGIAVETLIQQILTDNGIAETLITPVSPGWTIYPYVQERSSVMDALKVLSNQIGWRLCFIWNAGASAYRLTLFSPNRSAAVADKTLTVSEEVGCASLGIDVFSIRNAVRVIYGDASSRDPDGLPVRIVCDVSDPASIAKYGRRFMELREGDVSNIDSFAEATTLANAVLADLKEPTIGLDVTCPVDPFLEVGDMVQMNADGIRFSSALLLAVEKLRLSFSEGVAKTQLTLRGQPVAQRQGWLELDGKRKINKGDIHTLTMLDSTSPTQTAASVIGGQSIVLSDADSAGGKVKGTTMHEIHISETPGFTPSASTKRAGGSGRTFELQNLIPGKTYRMKTVPFTWNASQKVRGSPSDEVTFVAGRANAGHYDSKSTQSHLPLNGNFEHALDDLTSNPPDHWAVVTRPAETTEVWGSAGSVFYGTDALTKGRYIVLRASATQRGNLVSSAFEVRRALRAFNLYISIRRQGASAVSGKDLIVDIVGYSDSALTNVIINNSITLSGSAAGPYPALNTWYDAMIDIGAALGALGSSVNFITLGLRRGTTGDATFSWEIGDVYFQEADFLSARIDNLTLGKVMNLSHVRANTAVAGSYATTNVVQYATEEYDTNGEYNNATWTFTATVAGKYDVSACVLVASLAYAVGNFVQLTIQKNAANYAVGDRWQCITAATQFVSARTQTVMDLAVGDTVRVIFEFTRTAGNLSLHNSALHNYLTIDRIL
jgi:hypothetical protein